jgi:hypothetical protein
MKNIVIKKRVVVPNCPAFEEGQKVRVADHIAEALVGRKLAVIDGVEEKKDEKRVRKAESVKEVEEKAKESIV